MNKKVVIVTGASAGIGESISILLNENNFTVYAGARNIENNQELINKGVNVKNLDVSNDESVKEFVDYVLSKEKTIDILINNAGFALFGPVETVSLEDAKKELDVNLFGAARMAKHIIPIMRDKKEGLIINTVSALGKIPMFFADWYVASKFALEGLSDCMRMELAPFNIKVVKINPATVKTAMYYTMPSVFMDNMKDTIYEEDAQKVLKLLVNGGDGALLPGDVAKNVLEICLSKEPKSQYLVGDESKNLVAMKNKLSDDEYDKTMRDLLNK